MCSAVTETLREPSTLRHKYSNGTISWGTLGFGGQKQRFWVWQGEAEIFNVLVFTQVSSGMRGAYLG